MMSSESVFLKRSFTLTAGPGARRGIGSLDLFVAFTLLVAAMSVATPLVVRHGRVLKSQRNYRLALDELSNQLDRLSALPIEELPGAIERLAPSRFLAERLPGAKLGGELQPADTATRVTLRLSWNEGQRHSAPVALTAWVFPATPASGSGPREAPPQ
jgi:hypothetical protein